MRSTKSIFKNDMKYCFISEMNCWCTTKIVSVISGVSFCITKDNFIKKFYFTYNYARFNSLLGIFFEKTSLKFGQNIRTFLDRIPLYTPFLQKKIQARTF